MKQFRFAAGLMCLILLSAMLTGCGAKQETAPVPTEEDIFHVYATVYPLYALTEMIIGDAPDVQLSCLIQPQDGCIRNYQLSDWDIALLTGAADAMIAGGKGLESFESMLYSLGEDSPGVSAVLYDMALSSFDGENADEDSHWAGENPHIYMRTDGAIEILERISAALSILNPQNKALYEQNCAAAIQGMNAVQTEIGQCVARLEGQAVIVMNEALVYAAEEYGLEIAACIERESGEAYYDSTLEGCIADLNACGAKLILIEQQAPKAFCDALERAGFVIAKMDVLSTHSAEDGAEGYLDALRKNAEAVCAAFEAAGEEIA